MVYEMGGGLGELYVDRGGLAFLCAQGQGLVDHEFYRMICCWSCLVIECSLLLATKTTRWFQISHSVPAASKASENYMKNEFT